MARRCCVVCGRPVCDRCRRGPRHTALCEEHRGIRLFAGWAEALRTSSDVEAEIVAGSLRAAGIEAQVLSQKDRANVVTFGGLSVVRVLVPAFLLEDAQRALRSGDLPDAG